MYTIKNSILCVYTIKTLLADLKGAFPLYLLFTSVCELKSKCSVGLNGLNFYLKYILLFNDIFRFSFDSRQ